MQRVCKGMVQVTGQGQGQYRMDPEEQRAQQAMAAMRMPSQIQYRWLLGCCGHMVTSASSAPSRLCDVGVPHQEHCGVQSSSRRLEFDTRRLTR